MYIIYNDFLLGALNLLSQVYLCGLWVPLGCVLSGFTTKTKYKIENDNNGADNGPARREGDDGWHLVDLSSEIQ